MDEHPQPPLVLLVGHCASDARRLAAAVREAAPQARVEAVGDARTLAARLGQARLALVNRIPDGGFGQATGLDLITQAAQAGAQAMLVSNLPDAQAAAERAGAHPGFGKSELGTDQVRQRLAAALTRG